MKRFLLLSISLFLFTVLNAQQIEGQRMMNGSSGGRSPMEGGFGVLKGKIVDESSGLPVEYANIILYKQKDSSLVTGGITNTKGEFNIDKVPFGRYYVIVKFIGYNNTKVDGVMINPRQPEFTLETVKLKQASQSIEEVVVTGQKSMIQSNLDKKVINVDRSINAEGGTALDIMRNIPSVDVDVQGNVSLRGSSNLTILVDGKPSQISSLEELPSNIVQSVEVITNPSVRYDPDGMSGILNIVLKKKKTPGYHGMVSLNAGTGNKYSGTVNLNVRKNKLNFFGNFDYRHFYSNGSGFSETTSVTGIQTDNQDDSRDGLSNNFRGGIDYYINQKNTLSVAGSINVRNFNGDENSITLFNNIQTFDQKTSDLNEMNGKELTMNYKKTFDTQGREFTTDILYSDYSRNSEQDLFRFNSTQHDKTKTDGANNSLTIQSDFVTPFGNGGRIETGLKGIIRNQNSDYTYLSYLFPTSEWRDTSNLSNIFTYKDQIWAGYLIYSNTIGQFSYQGGLRAEEQIKDINQKTQDSRYSVSMFNYFPSAHIKWEMNKLNAFKVSFSKRVNRPSGRVLNPFIDKENVYRISYGNPYLKPEFTSSYELGHSLTLEKTNINTTLFYRRTTDKITQIYDIVKGPAIGTDTTKSTFTNLASGSTFGLEIVASQSIARWWKANGSFSFFNAKLDGYKYKSIIQESTESNSWTAKISSSFSISKNLEIQANGNYRSSVIAGISSGDRGPGGGGGGQGKTKEMYWVDLGLRYNILKNKGTITLRASDIFNTRKFQSTTNMTNNLGEAYTIYSSQWHESRIIFIGFSYKINDYKQRRDNKMDDNNDFENQ